MFNASSPITSKDANVHLSGNTNSDYDESLDLKDGTSDGEDTVHSLEEIRDADLLLHNHIHVKIRALKIKKFHSPCNCGNLMKTGGRCDHLGLSGQVTEKTFEIPIVTLIAVTTPILT
ncbi:hypothetical protein L1887_27166 [Cichorium endivia]|nr:hypothetical protein L1887_27166 [Cichorium endivia]